MQRRRRVSACAAAALVAPLSACVAEYDGFVAAGRFGGELTIAVVVCHPELEELAVTIPDPGGARDERGVPTERLRGVWGPRDGGQGVHLLDLEDPGEDWETVEDLPSISGIAGEIEVDARGSSGGHFESVSFTLEDFAGLAEDEWIYGTSTTTDLTATAQSRCG